MKATKLRLFATMITLAAVTTATILPAQAQRRSTQQHAENREPDRRKNVRETVQKKSTYKDYDKVQRTSVDPKLKAKRNVQQKSKTSVSRDSNNRNKNATINNSQNSQRSQSAPRTVSKSREDVRKYSTQPGNTNSRGTTNRNAGIYANRSSKTDVTRSSNRSGGDTRYTNNKSGSTSSRSNIRKPDRSSATHNRNFYRVDNTDKRYIPNKNYKGKSGYWTGNKRPGKMNYNRNDSKYYSRYNHQKYNHWDRNWERYRWNQNSWRDYYYGYNPRSYVYHNHYYHHYKYGHVIRRFDYRPQIFVHNHHNYYCYNGHFFRYRMGVGYVLVDLPFGFEFDYLPRGYEQVYINGYMYFRLGNLFFEWGNQGFSLVHYPERYYAYNDGYISQGYHFNDDYNYDEF
ncbi:hypothetical protein OU798_05260 [Prolixibacteraceae bacterium Z1-6]|uniref:Uncharacterized protein n=1 Tax=Draconibacterium aestuarii TaxID=2998507 RepID=A0A9X3F373_9BACT|nr:hypothetical protein [Prolixibacteraceae bacterium Z1-6]